MAPTLPVGVSAVQLAQQREYRLEGRAVRRIQELRPGDARLVEDGLLVTERDEAALAVISAHARGADAAEGQLLVDEMPQRIVDGDAARDRLAQHSLAPRAIPPEVVEGERPRAHVDLGDRL